MNEFYYHYESPVEFKKGWSLELVIIYYWLHCHSWRWLHNQKKLGL